MQVSQIFAIPTGWEDSVLSQAQVENLLAQAGHSLLQVQGGGHLLGCVAAGAQADIVTLYVPENLRRQGRAAALLQAFLAQAKTQGATGLSLEVRADNTGALALYTAAGLREVHRRVGYYGGVDALVLSLDFA